MTHLKILFGRTISWAPLKNYVAKWCVILRENDCNFDQWSEQLKTEESVCGARRETTIGTVRVPSSWKKAGNTRRFAPGLVQIWKQLPVSKQRRLAPQTVPDRLSWAALRAVDRGNSDVWCLDLKNSRGPQRKQRRSAPVQVQKHSEYWSKSA